MAGTRMTRIGAGLCVLFVGGPLTSWPGGLRLSCGYEASCPLAAQVTTWTLSEAPELSVSESGGSPSFQIHQAFYGWIGERGEFVVGNTGTGNLIYFDAEGTALRVTGGPGQGPGEFERIGGVYDTGEGLAVWDSRTSRASFFSLQGDFRSAVRLGEGVRTGDQTNLVGYISGIGPVTRSADVLSELRPASDEPRRYRLWDAQGGSLREVAGPPEPRSSRFSWAAVSEAGRPVNAGGSLPRGCLASLYEVVVGEEIFTVDAGAGVVRATSSAGATREVYRAGPRSPIVADMLDSLRATFAAIRYPPPADTLESALRRMGDIGDPLPAWDTAVPDPSGRLWLGVGDCPGASDRMYEVITTDGELLGTIRIPANLRLLAVRQDRALLVRTDALRVEHVEMYRIRNRG